ncbi:hypothetical protein BH09PLA1_BH09PLA1_29920 [soil metagenome]
MEQRPPRSVVWAYVILLAVSWVVIGFGVYLLWRSQNANWMVLSVGILSAMFVLSTWPIAMSVFSLRNDFSKALTEKLTPMNDTMDQMSVLLNLISEQQLLTERAKSVAFREKERDTLRRAIQEEIARQDWEAALALANEIEIGFGYKSEADRCRAEVSQRRSDVVRRQVNDAIAGIDRHMRGENWGAAQREAERLMAIYPADEQVQRLPQDIEARRQSHKRQLLESWHDSVNRKDVDGAIEILKRLDTYLTPAEADSMQEAARTVFKEKLNILRSQFSACVQDDKWLDALRIAEEVIRDFPNTQMAKEMRDMLPNIKERASGNAPQMASA